MNNNREIRVLIVEDDPIQAQLLKDKLLEFNSSYQLLWYKTGEEMLSFLEKNYSNNKPFYLILDYFLQTSDQKDALNGLNIIEQLEVSYPKTKTILFSAYENDEDTQFEKIQEKSTVLSFVKKTDYAYSRIQNLINFDFSEYLLQRKKKRLYYATYGFGSIVILSLIYLFFTYFFS